MKKLAYILGAMTLVVAPLSAAKAITAPETLGAVAPAEVHTDPSVIVFDQKAQESKVTFTYVYLPHDGYVALYGSDSEGKAKGEAIGYVRLPAGDHRNVTVDITPTLESGMTLWASVYRAVGEDTKLNKSEDQAYWRDGKPLENRFSIL